MCRQGPGLGILRNEKLSQLFNSELKIVPKVVHLLSPDGFWSQQRLSLGWVRFPANDHADVLLLDRVDHIGLTSRCSGDPKGRQND